VAKKAGLAGKTEEEEIFADVILEHVNDFVKGDDKTQCIFVLVKTQYIFVLVKTQYIFVLVSTVYCMVLL
jgi:hypothetical protein